MEVSELVLNVIAKQNGRFLKQDGAGWIEVTHEMAREKVSMDASSLRHHCFYFENQPMDNTSQCISFDLTLHRTGRFLMLFGRDVVETTQEVLEIILTHLIASRRRIADQGKFRLHQFGLIATSLALKPHQ